MMGILYVGSYGLKFYTLIRVKNERSLLSDPHFWDLVEGLNESLIEKQKSVYETFYWLNNGKI